MPTPTLPTSLVLVLLTAVTADTAVAQQQSSMLDRGDLQLSGSQGVINSVSGSNLDAGWNMIDVVSPRNFAPAGSGVATPRLVYALYPDLDTSSNVVLRVRRSTDGGRNWDPPVDVYTADTPGGEDLNTGDEGTHIYAWGDEVYVTFHTNAHDKTQIGQSLWVVASADQGVTWSAPLNVSTGWNTGGVNDDWDVDATEGATTITGLHLVWEADKEDPLNPGFPYAAPNNNENLYYARVDFSGSPPSLAIQVPETALTSHPLGGADIDAPSIAAQANVVLVAYLDGSMGGVTTNGKVLLSRSSFDVGTTFGAPFVHSGLTPGTFPLGWAPIRRAYALLDGGFAYVIQEDSRFDEDDVWMDRGDVNQGTQQINWSVTGVRCNHTSTVAGSGDIDSIRAAVHDGVLAILYRDDSAGGLGSQSNEAYLVVDQNGGDDFINGTFQRHMVSTTTTVLYDLEVLGNMVVGVFESCITSGTPREEGGIVLSSDRGTTVEASVFTSLGACNGGTIDVDDLQGALSLNGDFNVIYVDQRLGGPLGGNSNNVAWITGGKYPRLTYDGPTLTMRMDKLDPNLSVPSALSFLMISTGRSGTDVPGSIGVAGAGRGIFVGLTNDVLYNVMWANATGFLASVSATGSSTWTSIPNATALVGIPIHVAAVAADINDLATDPFKSYTDPILQ